MILGSLEVEQERKILQPFPIQLKYIFLACFLPQSPPNTFVKKKELKTRDFCSFRRNTYQGLSVLLYRNQPEFEFQAFLSV